jgi:hypothetical protein
VTANDSPKLTLMINDKKPVRILCLDDEPAPLGAYKSVLEPHGYGRKLCAEESTNAVGGFHSPFAPQRRILQKVRPTPNSR